MTPPCRSAMSVPQRAHVRTALRMQGACDRYVCTLRSRPLRSDTYNLKLRESPPLFARTSTLWALLVASTIFAGASVDAAPGEWDQTYGINRVIHPRTRQVAAWWRWWPLKNAVMAFFAATSKLTKSKSGDLAMRGCSPAAKSASGLAAEEATSSGVRVEASCAGKHDGQDPPRNLDGVRLPTGVGHMLR